MLREGQRGTEHGDEISPPRQGHREISRRELLAGALAGLAGACIPGRKGLRETPSEPPISKDSAVEQKRRELEDSIQDFESQIYDQEANGQIVPSDDVLPWNDETIAQLKGRGYWEEGWEKYSIVGPDDSPLEKSGLKQNIERSVKEINEALPSDCAISDIQIIDPEEGITGSDGGLAIRWKGLKITFTDGAVRTTSEGVSMVMIKSSDWRDASAALSLIVLVARQEAAKHQLEKLDLEKGR